MNFTKDIGLVKTWVSLVLCGVFTVEQVPNLFNLRTVVREIVESAMFCWRRQTRIAWLTGILRTRSWPIVRRFGMSRNRADSLTMSFGLNWPSL